MGTLFHRYAYRAIVLGVLITLFYIWYIFPGITSAAPLFPSQPHLNVLILQAHIFTAIPPLLLGLIAFHPVMRRNDIKLHRWVGTLYCVSIWLSSITGILLASANTRGIVPQLGFGLLGVMWFFTTYQAYVTGRSRQLIKHREWMIRSYALTLAVVSVRPMFWFGPPGFINPEHWYPMVSWLCWVPNLMAGEIYLRLTTFAGKLKPLSLPTLASRAAGQSR